MSAYLKYKIGDVEKNVQCNSILTIGRDKGSDITLGDLKVSRHHAMVRRLNNGDYYFIDSGSSNGSYVNKRRIAMPALLKDGDHITIGNIVFVFDKRGKDEGPTDTLSMQDTIVVQNTTIKQNTILVADIRGFTSLSEKVHIKTLTKVMNKWFHNVSTIIFENEGTVDKFIGDCVFARWETEKEQAKSVVQALRAAWLIGKFTEKLNDTFTEIDHKIKIGVGINTGKASVGIGQDNTALGDAVNTAFRLESASKTIGKDFVISNSSYEFLPKKYWQGKEQYIRVKGKRDKLCILGLDFNQVETILKKMKLI